MHVTPLYLHLFLDTHTHTHTHTCTYISTANFSCIQISHIALIFTESGTEFTCAHTKRVYLFASKHKSAQTITVSKNSDLQYFRESPRNT